MKTLAETFWEQLAPGGGFPQFMQWKQHLLRTLLAIAWAVIGCAAVAGTPDRSTPLAAAKSYLTAIKEGNAMVMGTGSLGTTNQKQWMFQFMRCYLADQKLETAAVEKFGREATEKSFGEMKRTFQAVPQALAALTNCDVRMEGDHATIIFRPLPGGDTPEPLKLQKAAGEWRVALGAEIEKADFSPALMEAQASSMEKCAEEIRAGKYQTPEQAQQGMMAAMMARYMQSPEQQALRAPRPGRTNDSH